LCAKGRELVRAWDESERIYATAEAACARDFQDYKGSSLGLLRSTGSSFPTISRPSSSVSLAPGGIAEALGHRSSFPGMPLAQVNTMQPAFPHPERSPVWNGVGF